MEWIITCKVSGKNHFRVFDAFEQLGAIDWRVSPSLDKLQIGDVVYIYVGVPHSKIMIKTICTIDNVKKEDLINDSIFGVGTFSTNENPVWRCARLKFVKCINDDNLSLNHLVASGYIKRNIQGVFKSTNNKELFNYICSVFE